MSMPGRDDMCEMLRFNTQFNLERANKSGTTSKRMTDLVARKLCPHAYISATILTGYRMRIRCTDCGATAIHREKK